MKYEIETKYPVGTTFYGVEGTIRRAYAPCVVCKNERKIYATGGDGKQYAMNCPECSNKATKGDMANSIEVVEYSVVPITVEKYIVNEEGFWVNYNKVEYSYDKNVTIEQFEKLIADRESIEDYCFREYGMTCRSKVGVTYLSDNKEYIKKLVTAANKIEREKRRKIEKGE